MASRLRIGAALLGASVALTLSALPATAEVVVKPDKSAGQQGLDVYLKETGGKKYDTSLIGLKVIDREETKVQAYCVELPTPLKDSLGLKEVPWDQHPNEDSLFRKNPDRNREKINWILHNSYPEVPAAKLGSGVDEKEAIAGTQAAIWHFSDGANLNTDKVNDDVVKVYEKLTGKDNQGLDVQPEPTLKVAPTFKEGVAGEKIGPFTVVTTADQVKVKGKLPKGVTITDKDGKPLEQVSDAEVKGAAAPGDKVTEFFVNVPKDAAAGEAKFALEVNATLEKGRLFVQSEAGDDKKTQSLIVAAPSKVTVDADASAKWVAAPVVTQPSTPVPTTTTAPTTTTTTTTPAPAPGGGNDDDLASTGASIFVPLGIGLGLLGAGAGALFFLRRKKASA